MTTGRFAHKPGRGRFDPLFAAHARERGRVCGTLVYAAAAGDELAEWPFRRIARPAQVVESADAVEAP